MHESLDRFELATGEIARSPDSYVFSKLKEPNPDLRISVNRASRGRAPIDEGTGKIGTVHYWKGREYPGGDDFQQSEVTFRLYLSDEDYASLYNVVTHGSTPSTFSLTDIEGIERSGPEGNDLRWDNNAKEILPIDSVSWTFDAAAPAPPQPVEPTPAEPPTKPKGQSWGMWAFVAFVTGLVWLLFRK